MVSEPWNRPVKYRDNEFKISYTIEKENLLKSLLSQAYDDLDKKEIHRSHEDLRRCRVCGYRDICDGKK